MSTRYEVREHPLIPGFIDVIDREQRTDRGGNLCVARFGTDGAWIVTTTRSRPKTIDALVRSVVRVHGGDADQLRAALVA